MADVHGTALQKFFHLAVGISFMNMGTVITGCRWHRDTDDKLSACGQYSCQFLQALLIVWQMFDHFGTEHRITDADFEG